MCGLVGVWVGGWRWGGGGLLGCGARSEGWDMRAERAWMVRYLVGGEWWGPSGGLVVIKAEEVQNSVPFSRVAKFRNH